jgi:hypothetical protein
VSGEELDSKDEGPCRTIAIKEYLLRRLRSYLLSLLDREPPLLNEDSDVWHRPRRKPGDLAEARLFAFLKGSI